MIGHARTAVKFFVYGLLAGLLFAPRSGEETRQELMNWVSGTIQDTVKSVSGGSGGSGTSGSSSQT